MEHVFGRKWIKVKTDRVYYYVNTAIYRKTKNGMIKYKNAGIKIKEKKYMPEDLYIRFEDRILAYKELSEKFKKEINEAIDKKNLFSIQNKLIEIANEIFEEPRHGSVIPASTLTDCVTKKYFSGALSLKIFSEFSKTDYTTITHSMHIMALVIQYCKYKEIDIEKTKNLANAAMLHDIGKAYIDNKILVSSGPLNSEERKEIEKHPIYGYDILNNLGLEYEADIALKHHERLDGSGYPKGLQELSEEIQLIGIIDSYEAMTSDHRVYANIKTPYEALKELRNEVNEGKFKMSVYSNFVRSLSSIT